MLQMPLGKEGRTFWRPAHGWLVEKGSCRSAAFVLTCFFFRSFWVNPVLSPLCGGSRRGLGPGGPTRSWICSTGQVPFPFRAPVSPCLCCQVHSCEERPTAPPRRRSSRSADGTNSCSGLLGPHALSPDASAEAGPLPCSAFPDPASSPSTWGRVLLAALPVLGQSAVAPQHTDMSPNNINTSREPKPNGSPASP